jgi:hypothetical protein
VSDHREGPQRRQADNTLADLFTLPDGTKLVPPLDALLGENRRPLHLPNDEHSGGLQAAAERDAPSRRSGQDNHRQTITRRFSAIGPR